MCIQNYKSHQGLSVIELVLAMLILSVGFVAVTTMLVSLLQQGQNSFEVQKNIQSAKDILQMVKNIPINTNRSCQINQKVEYLCLGDNQFNRQQKIQLVQDQGLVLFDGVENFDIQVKLTSLSTSEFGKLISYALHVKPHHFDPIVLSFISYHDEYAFTKP